MASNVLYITTVSFAVGIFIRSFFTVPLGVVLVLVVVSGGAAWWWTHKHSSRALFLSLACLFAALGLLRMDMTSWDQSVVALNILTEETGTYEGVIMREPEQRERTTHLYVGLEKPEALILLYASRNAEVEYGDHVRVTGTVTRPQSFETDLGRTFNYPGYLEARGVTHVMFYPDIEVVAGGCGYWFMDYLLRGKHHFMRSVEQLLVEPQAGLGEGLLLGVKSALGAELEEVFRKTGIIHIVVLSGYNVMLVVVFVMTILSYFLGHRARLPFGVAAIGAFALLVGLSATVVRASIMAVLILVARATGHSYGVMRALFFAGFVMLLFNPHLLVFDPGFQLSFVATLGLILLAPRLEELLGHVPSVIGVREFLVATLATQMFVLPLLLYQIGEFSVVAVVVNVLVLPMVPVAMLLTFITGIVGLVSTSAALPIAYMTHASLSYIIIVATWFAALPFASFVVPPFPFVLMVMMYVGLGYVLWRWLQELSVEEAKETVTVAVEDWTVEIVDHEKETAELPRGSSAKDTTFFSN